MNILFENDLHVPIAFSVDETTTLPISLLACHIAIASTNILYEKQKYFIDIHYIVQKNKIDRKKKHFFFLSSP